MEPLPRAVVRGEVPLGCVALKLFPVDLSGIGTIERIVSFISEGVMMVDL
jgi:uncharacterized membrane protein